MRARSLLLALALLSFPLLGLAANNKPSKDASAGLFGRDKVWSMHLTIQPDQWEKMQPKRGGFGFPPKGEAKPGEAKGDAKPGQVKNDAKAAEVKRDVFFGAPEGDAKRRGMFGFDFAYVKGNLEIDGHRFPDVGVRFKGNGSYAMSMGRLKRPFKIDLDRYNSEEMFHGQKKLTLNSNALDATMMREVLSYAVYRSLDVPAPRTAYVRLTLTVPGKYDKEFLGLYTLVETIDKTFLKKHFGSAKGLLLKPERIGPLEYLGDEWQVYENRYIPKTPADSKSKHRLIEFAKLVQKDDDKAFNEQIDKYLDVDEFLRFLAVTATLANMDSFIGLTHNYVIYLNPKTNKFVLMPWDLDLSFGAFGFGGSADDIADLSIRQPHINKNRLIERVLADEKNYAVYKEHLRKLVEKGFTAEGVRNDVAALNALLEPIKKQEQEASAARKENQGRQGFGGFPSAPPDLPGFAAKRVASIKEQIDGKRKGTVLAGRFGFGVGQFLVRPVLEAADKDKDGKLTNEEMSAAVKSMFAKLDKDHKGELNQDVLTEGINDLLPRPPGFGGPAGPGGRPDAKQAGPQPGGPPAKPGGSPAAASGAAPGAKPRGQGGAPPGGPPAAAPGGRPAFAPPGGGLGGMFARSIVEKAGKDGKVNEERMLSTASKLFAEADKNKDGKLDDKELIDALNKLMPPIGAAGGGRPAQAKAPPAAAPGAPAAGQKESKKEGK
jgi:spore coat protein H